MSAASAEGGGGGRVMFETVDVTSDEQVKAFAEKVTATLGVPHIVVNNAGIINANARLWEVPPQEMQAVLAVNVLGTANAVRHFAPAMVSRRQGVIVNMSSGWGRSASAQVAPYCASKWAVEGLTKALSQELPSGVAAVALNPGVIDTAMLQSCFGASAGGYQKPEDWAPRAADLILGLRAADNGASLTV
eukprot:TRINITY_DN11709_c0_g1_i1.p1 TRINITY_DN11709_c0_g1~~TRINITY_DN11709_c0_g1_i1.p1  ORF type:complete len:203 (+),score=1.45 TRINITY_DN11709_c0_g1_i1:41-610(+)